MVLLPCLPSIMQHSLARSFSSREDVTDVGESLSILAKAVTREKLWRKFFADPSQWWDNRFNEKKQRCPDFVHSKTKEGLWIDGWLNPSWVKAELAALKQGKAHSTHPVRAAYLRDAEVKCGIPQGNSVSMPKKNNFSCAIEDVRKFFVEQCHEAFEVMDIIWQQNLQVPVDILYWLLHSCINRKDFAAGRKVHFLIKQSGHESNAFLGGDLIRMYTLCKSIAEAELVFHKLTEPNNYTWRAIISAHTKCGECVQAIKLYHKMRESTVKPNSFVFVAALKACSSIVLLDEGKQIHAHIIESGFEADLFVISTLIDMYSKCESLEDAKLLFNRITKRDAVTQSAMITGYARHGHDQKALQLFHEGTERDAVTFVSGLKVSSNMTALNEGKLIHCHIIDIGLGMNTHLGCALITMYGNCGNLVDANRVFEKLSKRSVVPWNALIAGYVLNNNHKLALHNFETMQQEGVEPNDVTFVCLLSACSDFTDVEECYHHLGHMTKVRGIIQTVEHYNCMVSVLASRGCINEAEDLLQTIPFQANVVGWKSLLNNCRLQGNVELGKQCFEQVVSIDCTDSSGYVLLSNVFADAEMWDCVRRTEELRRCIFASKIPGKTFIEVQNKIHEFFVGDRSHVQSHVIYEKIQRSCALMKDNGHMPCIKLVLRPAIC